MALNVSVPSQKQFISVIIATKNRPNDLKKCLRAISNNTFRSYEVIVADQSRDCIKINKSDFLSIPKLIYIRALKGGKTTALNLAISRAQGDLLAFTDDDCIVSNHWLSAMHYAAIKYSTHSAFFGKTKPYQSEKHKGFICPSIFTSSIRKSVSKPCPHFLSIGFGNNMAIRTDAIQLMNGFRPWLGPGSIGSNAEDADIALRLLVNNHKILYEPTMTVFHNRWLTTNQMFSQTRSYTCGETACYGYFFFQGYAFAFPVLKSSIVTILHQLYSGKNVFHEFLNLLFSFRGLFVALWYSQRDPIA